MAKLGLDGTARAHENGHAGRQGAAPPSSYQSCSFSRQAPCMLSAWPSWRSIGSFWLVQYSCATWMPGSRHPASATAPASACGCSMWL